ncbi:MAG: DEAD/DEAH box helicase [Candidatus Delongbacteria bacterium]|nr:DEAD/DEAH box helicase [Candidatus Delongbacteria bacterium]
MTKTTEINTETQHHETHFHSLNIIKPILKAIKEEGYSVPTPIQEQCIPIVLKGADVLGCAQTGTGKTAAFAIPILQLLETNRTYEDKRKVKALVVTPTRELAIQIGESFAAYGRHTGIKHAVIFGGVKQHSQVKSLKSGVDVIVATPGRLLDLMNQGYLNLRNVEYFVLDEADRMLDMGFIHDVKKMIAVLPKKRQSLFFSATMPKEIVTLASTILNDPAQISVTPVSSTVEIVKQYVYFVDKGNKSKLLLEILQDNNIHTALVFTRTKYGADKLVKILHKYKIIAEAIHGNKSQNARQRALANFKAKTTRVLLATDIAARGIDIDDMEYVINYEIPNISETYVHRIGRTARAGAEGTAISFCDADEKLYLRDIEKLIKKKIEVIEDHPYPLIDHNPIKVEKQPRGKRISNKTPKKSSGSQHIEFSEENVHKSHENKSKKKWKKKFKKT